MRTRSLLPCLVALTLLAPTVAAAPTLGPLDRILGHRGFHMDVSPDHQTIAPGERAAYDVVLAAKRSQTLDLTASASRGFVASLSERTVHLEGGARKVVQLVVREADATIAEGNATRPTEGRACVSAVSRETNASRTECVTIAIKEGPRAPTLSLVLDPPSQKAQPGDKLRYAVHVKTDQPRLVKLAITKTTRGYTATLEDTVLHTNKTHAWTWLYVSVHNATTDGHILVEASSDDARARAVAHVALAPQDPSREPPRNETGECCLRTASHAPAPRHAHSPRDAWTVRVEADVRIA